ncbi:MAG: amidase family protein, partial [Promethearchaeota archaeon]
MNFYEFLAFELIEKIKNKEISIKEVIQQVYERIERTDDKLHSFVHLSKEKALNKAKGLDNKLKRGKPIGKLYGLPIGIKDLICIKDSPTTCGSNILQGYKPPYNATVIENLIEKEDAICVGRTNMDEFAMGSSTENSSYGP